MSEPWKRKEVIGNQTLYLGDSLEILPTLGKVDAVVTDPPYGIGETRGGSINTPKAKGDYSSYCDTQDNLKNLIAALHPFLDGSIPAGITPGRTNMWLYPQPKDVGMFYQPAATSMSFWGRATWQPILFYGKDPFAGKTITPLHWQLTEQPEKNGHPCPKPIKAWSKLVARISKEGQTILDPFMGSGTTLVACQQMGRKGIGIEIDPDYFEIACERVRNAYMQPDLFLET